MLSRYVKFAASTVLAPGCIGLLSGVQKSRYGLCLKHTNQYDEVQIIKKSEALRSVVYHQPQPSTKSEKVKTSVKVAILGANGAVGQMLSLFLKQCPLIDTLSLYDITSMSGTALDISHIDTSCKVFAYNGPDRLKDALDNADIVIITAGVAQTPSMPKGYLFCKNAEIVYDLMHSCCEVCPKALIGVLTDPLNSIVPLICEVQKKNKCYEENRVFGIVSSHMIRASTFVAERMGLDPTGIIVPITGGCSSPTIVPVLSQTKPLFSHSSSFFSEGVFKFLVNRIRNATGEVMKANKGSGAPSLSTAYAAARFTHSLAKGLCGKQAIECVFTCSNVLPVCPYLIAPVELGPNGVKRICGLPKLTNFEKGLLDKVIPDIVNEVKQGEDFVSSPPLECLSV